MAADSIPSNESGSGLESECDSEPETKSREQLAAELHRLHGVIDHIGAYVFTKDLQGRYTYVNQSVCDMLKLSREEILGQTDDAFFNLEESPELIEFDRRVLEHGERIAGEEKNLVAGTGEVRYYWTEKLPLYDQAGNIVGLSGISTDITERKRLEAEARQHKDLLDTVLNNVDAHIFMKDSEATYLYANKVTAELLGVPQQELIGKSDHELFPPELIERFSQLDKQLFRRFEKVRGEETFMLPDGKIRHFWSIKIPLEHESGNPAYVGISTDITEVVRLRDKYERLANRDSLTDLMSRGHLLYSAEREVKRARRKQSPATVVILDIDHFKEINDNYGHAAGDQTLAMIADALKSTIRDMDLLGRLGGDEFALIAPDTGQEDAERIAQRLQEAIGRLDMSEVLSPSNARLTVSMGIAVYAEEETLDELFARADRALYKVKNGGRNGYLLG